MMVKLDISYELLLDLVNQLPQAQKDALRAHLSQHQPKKLTAEEKIRLLREATIHIPVNEAPSIRREDWYDDNGR